MSSNDLIYHGVRYDVSTAQQQPSITLHELKARNIKYVRIVMLDLVNLIKYRIVPLEYFEKLLAISRPGITISKAIHGIIFGGIAPGFGPAGEYLYALDLTTLRLCPHAPGNASVLGWFEEKRRIQNVERNRAVKVDLCPRTILRRAVEDAKSGGVKFLVGFEIEFVLLTNTSPVEPINQNGWNSAGAFSSGAVETQVLEEIADYLTASGVELQVFHSEGAAGQYEVATGPLPPLQAIDALIHTRDIIHNVASKHGLRATFVPRVSAGAGTAIHTHISVHSANKSQPSSVHANLSHAESTFLAGLLQHLRSIALLALPTRISYKRMIDNLSAGGTYVCWGTDNREAQVRLCNAFSLPSRNFEIKCLDGVANPYLAVAAFIAAGMDGVLKDVECQMQDCATTTAANIGKERREKLGITERMPLKWEEANAAFADCKLVDEVFGSEFKTVYLGVNRTLQEQMEVGTEEEQLKRWVENY